MQVDSLPRGNASAAATDPKPQNLFKKYTTTLQEIHMNTGRNTQEHCKKYTRTLDEIHKTSSRNTQEHCTRNTKNLFKKYRRTHEEINRGLPRGSASAASTDPNPA